MFSFKSPPNFRVQTDFNSYVRPVVIIPEQSEDTSLDDEPNDLLIDISSEISHFDDNSQSALANLRDIDFQFYINEIERLKSELEHMRLDHDIEIRVLKEHIKTLENELLNSKSDLEQQIIVRAPVRMLLIYDTASVLNSWNF
jgi:hypothetical protein